MPEIEPLDAPFGVRLTGLDLARSADDDTIAALRQLDQAGRATCPTTSGCGPGRR